MNRNRTYGRTVRRHLLCIAVIIHLAAAAAPAAEVQLRWDEAKPAPEGYRVFSRTAEGAYAYDRPAWEGASTTCRLTDLAEGTIYCFTVRSVTGRRESADAEEVCLVPSGIDNDGDGMPDDWEYGYGLDFLVDDAEADADGDGVDNRDEYRSGMEPDYAGEGEPPHTPAPIPDATDTDADQDPLLGLDAYTDAEGDAHIATQWQLVDDPTEERLMDVVSDRRLERLRVPLLLLSGAGTYRWRARVFDSGGRASDWSAESVFTTQPASNDGDRNGIPDDQETASAQVDVGSSAALTTEAGAPASIAVDSDDTVAVIERVMLADPADFDTDETTPSPLPATLVAYRLALDEPGQQARVTIHLAEPAPPGSAWIRYDAVTGWQPFEDRAVLSADRRSVTIETTDGGPGDADGIANGVVLEAAGLQRPALDDSPEPADGEEEPRSGGAPETESPSGETAAQGSAGGGGCFVATLGETP